LKIASVAHAVPSERITNEWILDEIRRQSEGRVARATTEILADQVRMHLEAAGTEVRYRLAPGESGIDFAIAAANQALGEAGLVPGDVDFVIYAGVGRGWIEPASAHALQGALGLVNASAFDVLDACASWLRALHVAHAYLQSGTYRTGLIVNCECGFASYGDLCLTSSEELDDRFATCTIGEAATATVVVADPDGDFHFTFKSYGDDVGLCMIPLATLPYFRTSAVPATLTPLRFSSRSRELMTSTTRRIIEAFEADPALADRDFDVCFGHAASDKATRVIGKKLGIPYERYYSTHPTHGNTVAASVPLGMSLALREGRLRRGHRVLAAVGASGVSVGIATFTF
jgi:3-oxoacyl-[acyl-carrier-protein] synthase III